VTGVNRAGLAGRGRDGGRPGAPGGGVGAGTGACRRVWSSLTASAWLAYWCRLNP